MKVYLGYIGIMEKKMETTMVCWGYIGMMDKKIYKTKLHDSFIKAVQADQTQSVQDDGESRVWDSLQMIYLLSGVRNCLLE